MDVRGYFDRCHVVSLRRRPDRLKAFWSRLPEDWPFAPVQLFYARDGQCTPAPDWWTAGGGAWGCFRSHLHLIEQALNDGVESLLLLEDDALFVPDFTRLAIEFLEHVPEDWGMVYLGGQHLHVPKHPPQRINEHVLRAWNINRTHAFALRGEGMRQAYRHLCAGGWHKGHHIDHRLGKLHEQQTLPVYTPTKWLVGQADGKSNVCDEQCQVRFWDFEKKTNLETAPFAAVVGLHRSGTSCVAMMLHKLGVHMGNKLTGYESTGGGEASGLAAICEEAMPFPSKDIRDRDKLVIQLRKWIRDRQNEASAKGTIAGGKYPTTCAMLEELDQICGEGLKIVHCSRPLDESIRSLQRRSEKATGWLRAHDWQCSDLQKFLWNAKHDYFQRHSARPVYEIEYDRLLESPSDVVDEIVAFLGINPTDAQRNAAIQHVDPAQRHIAL